MTQVYGSDNESAEKVAILDVAPDSRRAQPSPSRMKRVVAGAIVALALLGAIVAFQTATTDHARKGGETVKPQPLTLASASVESHQAAYATDNPVLTSGEEFMILCGGKCVDDGRITKYETNGLYLFDCEPFNLNQRFVYDSKTNAIRNPSKNNLCWHDGGGVLQQFRLKTCEADNNDMKFVYNWTNLAIKVPSMPEWCASVNGDSIVLLPCVAKQAPQQFEIVPKAYW